MHENDRGVIYNNPSVFNLKKLASNNNLKLNSVFKGTRSSLETLIKKKISYKDSFDAKNNNKDPEIPNNTKSKSIFKSENKLNELQDPQLNKSQDNLLAKYMISLHTNDISKKKIQKIYTDAIPVRTTQSVNSSLLKLSNKKLIKELYSDIPTIEKMGQHNLIKKIDQRENKKLIKKNDKDADDPCFLTLDFEEKKKDQQEVPKSNAKLTSKEYIQGNAKFKASTYYKKEEDHDDGGFFISMGYGVEDLDDKKNDRLEVINNEDSYKYVSSRYQDDRFMKAVFYAGFSPRNEEKNISENLKSDKPQKNDLVSIVDIEFKQEKYDIEEKIKHELTHNYKIPVLERKQSSDFLAKKYFWAEYKANKNFIESKGQHNSPDKNVHNLDWWKQRLNNSKSFFTEKKQKPFSIFRQEKKFIHNASTERTSPVIKIRRKFDEDFNAPKKPFKIPKKSDKSISSSQNIFANPFTKKSRGITRENSCTSRLSNNEVSKLNFHDSNRVKASLIKRNSQFKTSFNRNILKKTRTTVNSLQTSFEMDQFRKSTDSIRKSNEEDSNEKVRTNLRKVRVNKIRDTFYGSPFKKNQLVENDNTDFR